VLRAGIGFGPRGGAIVEDVRAGHGRAHPRRPAPQGARRAGRAIAVRGWVGFAEAASLEWLERRESRATSCATCASRR